MSCPDCFRGGVSTTHPTGIETTIHGLPTYVAQPGEGVTPKGIIVIITDAFGWNFVNNRVKCNDPRAIDLIDKVMEPSSWFTTIFYKPIYAIQVMSLAIPWKMKTKISVTQAPVLSFFQALRTSPPPFPTNNLKIGAAGFCWGGKHTMLLAQDVPSSRVQRHGSQINSTTLEPLLDCAFTAHPSYIDVPNDIEAVTIPISVAVGDEDMAMKAPLVQQMKEILEAKKNGNHEVHIMPGAKHGFAIRTHPDDKHEMECAERAEVQAIEWFTRWFS